VGAGFSVKYQALTTRIHIIFGHRVGIQNHEVCFERKFGVGPHRRNYIWAEGQIRYKLTVHDVEVDSVASCGFKIRQSLTQMSEINWKYRRGNFDRSRHKVKSTASIDSYTVRLCGE
jgi:hypothetical protein